MNRINSIWRVRDLRPGDYVKGIGVIWSIKEAAYLRSFVEGMEQDLALRKQRHEERLRALGVRDV